MKTTTLILTAALALSACGMTPEQIAAQAERCAAYGHKSGTPDHAYCVERGAVQQKASQDAVAGAVTAEVLTYAILNQFW